MATFHLILEIMGKHSNLLLVNPTDNTILDGLKRYSHALSRHREVLPGRIYILPPAQGKIEPLTDEESWRKILYQADLDNSLATTLAARFAGLSPELAREIVVQAGLDTDTRLHMCGDIDLARLFQAYSRLANPDKALTIEPCVYFSEPGNDAPIAFSFVPFQQYFGLSATRFDSLDAAVASFYNLKAGKNSLEAKRGSLRKVVEDQQVHLTKKLRIYEETIAKAQKSLTYQKWGELITANVYRIKPGQAEVTVEDYYEPDTPSLTIPLDPNLTAIENAQYCYRLYNKAKAALRKTEPLQMNTLTELAYLDSIAVSIKQATGLTDLEDIHSELGEQGYVAARHFGKKDPKQKKTVPPEPRSYRSGSGRLILVGKNNRQNDWLTTKKGRPGDLWLHVKNIPGSHVLIPLADGEEFPDDATLEEAAALAVYFSQARGSSQVPVDYTHVRQVKKPHAAKPGMVIYEQNWTLYLTPAQAVLDRLLATENLSQPVE